MIISSFVFTIITSLTSFSFLKIYVSGLELPRTYSTRVQTPLCSSKIVGTVGIVLASTYLIPLQVMPVNLNTP